MNMTTGITTGITTSITKHLTMFNIGMLVAALVLVAAGIYAYFYFNKPNHQTNREGLENKSPAKEAEIMLFYADWCPHCKTAKPEWESVKSEYDGKVINGYKVLFKEYNCTAETPENEQLMDKYKVEGFPTIKLIKDNQVVEYDAKPSKDTIKQFLNSVL